MQHPAGRDRSQTPKAPVANHSTTRNHRSQPEKPTKTQPTPAGPEPERPPSARIGPMPLRGNPRTHSPPKPDVHPAAGDAHREAVQEPRLATPAANQNRPAANNDHTEPNQSQHDTQREQAPKTSTEPNPQRPTSKDRSSPQPTAKGLSDAPLSRGGWLGLFSGGFVAPHSADDAVGELSFVGSAGFTSGLAFCGFAGEVGGCFGLAALLGDRRDVEH